MFTWHIFTTFSLLFTTFTPHLHYEFSPHEIFTTSFHYDFTTNLHHGGTNRQGRTDSMGMHRQIFTIYLHHKFTLHIFTTDFHHKFSPRIYTTNFHHDIYITNLYHSYSSNKNKIHHTYITHPEHTKVKWLEKNTQLYHTNPGLLLYILGT